MGPGAGRATITEGLALNALAGVLPSTDNGWLWLLSCLVVAAITCVAYIVADHAAAYATPVAFLGGLVLLVVAVADTVVLFQLHETLFHSKGWLVPLALVLVLIACAGAYEHADTTNGPVLATLISAVAVALISVFWVIGHALTTLAVAVSGWFAGAGGALLIGAIVYLAGREQDWW